MDQEEKLLRRNLQRWRETRLREFAEQMLDIQDDYRAASEGLAIAHRNPGEVADDLTGYLWEKLNHSAIECTRLEEEHRHLMEMDLPELIIEANRHFAPKGPRQQESAVVPAAGLSNQVEHILTAWRDLLGIQLDPERVRAHLDSINKWQQQWRERRENAERS